MQALTVQIVAAKNCLGVCTTVRPGKEGNLHQRYQGKQLLKIMCHFSCSETGLHFF